MIVIENIIILVFLFCSITTLPAGIVYENDKLQNNESGQDLMNFEEIQHGLNVLRSEYTSRGGAVKTKYRWPNATIPYQIIGFSTEERAMIFKAMRTLEFWTCINFTPYNDTEHQHDYIYIESVPNGGCQSFRGRKGGEQRVLLQSPICFRDVGIPIHELLHVIGLVDHQKRPDRDNYIIVNETNVKPEAMPNFKKAKERIIGNFGVPYDYNSVMHYPSYAVSANGYRTVIPKNTGGHIGQRFGMSVRDAMLVMKMYECNLTEFNVSDTDSFSNILPNVAYEKENASPFAKEKLFKTYFRNISST